MEFGTIDFSEIMLRVVGAFYAFAGYAATRACLTSYFIDRAIAAIAAKKPTAAETMQAMWLLCAAALVLVGGVMLMLLLDAALWVFLASAVGQTLYLFFVAPRYFDLEEPPDAKGRQQSTNAFVVYCAATAFVLWATYTGRLVSWQDIWWPLLAAAAAAVAGHIGYVVSTLTGPMAFRKAPLRGAIDGGLHADPSLHRSESKRVKVMAEYDASPLWALDEGLYGDFPPEDLGLSPELTRDLNTWADEYTSSLNRDDPANSLWSEPQHRTHEAAGRPLAVRLARERPDLMIYILAGATGVVEVHADE